MAVDYDLVLRIPHLVLAHPGGACGHALGGEEMTTRYTPHTFSGYWWVCDNLTGEPVCNSAGARRTFHINSLGIEKAAERAKGLADRLNAEAQK